MRQKSGPEKEPATQVVKNIRRATRRQFSAEDKIRIVLEGLRGEDIGAIGVSGGSGKQDQAVATAGASAA
jgi:transposase-like protein